MESRKRPHEEDDNETSAKKRILSDDDGSASPNGVGMDSGEPTEGDHLEMFRKEAIYRRMKHYAREHERSEARVAELERRKRSCEAGLAVMSACWSQLMETVRSLLSPEDVPDIHVDASKLFEITSKSPSDQQLEVNAQLEGNLAATRTLVTRLAQLGGNHTSKVVNDEDVAKYRQGCAILETQLSLSRAQVDDLEARNAQLQDALHAAENRVERARSSTVAAMQRLPTEPRDDSKSAPKAKSTEPVAKPSSPSHSPLHRTTNGKPSEESFPELDEHREKKLNEYKQENARLVAEKADLSARLEKQPDTATWLYQVELFARRAEYLGSDNIGPSVSSRLDQAITDIFTKAAEITTQPLKPDQKILLVKRDSETARLRELRDQMSAELLDRKLKDPNKFPSVQAYKNALESYEARLAVSESQIRRYKARLVSESGFGDIFEFLVGPEGNIVPELTDRLRTAEARIGELERLTKAFETAHSDVAHYIKSEATLKSELQEVSSRIDQYKKIFGETPSSLPNAEQFLVQLQQKDQELEVLRKQVFELEQVEAQLSSEVERLSNAWERHEATFKGKLLEVAPLEERLIKFSGDRSKLENKFYAAMREKDAAEVARKSMEKAYEKLSSTLDKCKETQQQSDAALLQMQKTNETLSKVLKTSDVNVRDFERRLSEAQVDLASQKQSVHQLQCRVKYLEQEYNVKSDECSQHEEAIIRMKKDFERQIERTKESSSLIQMQGPNDNHSAQMREILQCRICKRNIRDTVIKKCMHTFCRECLDTRIATRQRKCPSCQLAFGHGDLNPIYFQG